MTLEELTAIRRNAAKWEWLARLDSVGWLALAVGMSIKGPLPTEQLPVFFLLLPLGLAALCYTLAFGMAGWKNYRQARRQLYLAEFYLGEPPRPRDSTP